LNEILYRIRLPCWIVYVVIRVVFFGRLLMVKYIISQTC
jgi:hypothetical protein